MTGRKSLCEIIGTTLVRVIERKVMGNRNHIPPDRELNETPDPISINGNRDSAVAHGLTRLGGGDHFLVSNKTDDLPWEY